MGMMGNRASDALKFILFKKQFRITNASNIALTSHELMNVIERDPGVIWRFVWEMSDLVFVPLDFVYSLLMLVYALGYSTLTGVVMYGVVYCVNWQKDKFNRASDESIRVIEELKQAKLNEIFEYAKHLKLFGWQKSFESNFHQLRAEERELQEKRAYWGLIASNFQQIVSQFLPTSIFMT